jgi:hypothetical protein
MTTIETLKSQLRQLKPMLAERFHVSSIGLSVGQPAGSKTRQVVL